MKRIQMREETRRAVSDICGILLSRYGMVPTFGEIEEFARAIDREFLALVKRGSSMTPDSRQIEMETTVKIVEDTP